MVSLSLSAIPLYNRLFYDLIIEVNVEINFNIVCGYRRVSFDISNIKLKGNQQAHSDQMSQNIQN